MTEVFSVPNNLLNGIKAHRPQTTKANTIIMKKLKIVAVTEI